MAKLNTRHYSDVYIIYDIARKKKLQELFIRSVNNDINSWTKKIYVNVDKEIKTTRYSSPLYNKLYFMFDYDKNVVYVKGGDITELVFDYVDYRKKKYPDDVKIILDKLKNNVNSDNLKDLDKLIKKSPNTISEELSKERKEKLDNIFGKK